MGFNHLTSMAFQWNSKEDGEDVDVDTIDVVVDDGDDVDDDDDHDDDDDNDDDDDEDDDGDLPGGG